MRLALSLLFVAVVMIACIICNKVSARLGIPMLLAFILLGMFFGSDGVIKIRALEAFAAAANGKATKIIIPSEIQSLAGLAASAKTVLGTEDPENRDEPKK